MARTDGGEVRNSLGDLQGTAPLKFSLRLQVWNLRGGAPPCLNCPPAGYLHTPHHQPAPVSLFCCCSLFFLSFLFFLSPSFLARSLFQSSFSILSLSADISWCNNNHMDINPIKTKSMTIVTRPKHQLTTRSVSKQGKKNDQVSEHRLLGITTDSKLCWDSHANNVCKTVSRRRSSFCQS